jgi:putative ABC transport system ATP-binding protein
MKLFTQAARDGVAVVLVTHERQIPPCANRHFSIEAGKLTETGKEATGSRYFLMED